MQSKIQVIGYREYTDKEDGQKKIGTYFYNRGVRFGSVAELFLNIDKALMHFSPDEQYNLHYTVANYEEQEKSRSGFKFQDVLPIDIDGIDTTRLQEYIDIVGSTLDLDLAATGIVSSGNGLHFLIQLERPITDEAEFKVLKPKYKTICDKITNALEAANLAGELDTNVFRVTATLRLPNTRNVKPSGTKKCTLLNAFILPQNFDIYLYEDKQSAVSKNKTLQTIASKVDVDGILNGCEFVKHCRDNPNQVSEPEWFAMIGIVSFLPDGRTLAHTYSAGHSRYNRAETDHKIDAAMDATGPRTCESVSLLSDKCKSCIYAGKINTPLQIRSEGFVRTKDTYFHDVSFTEQGVLKIGKPNFPDLYRQFRKEFKHIIVADSIYVYNDTHWQFVDKKFILNWASKKFDVHSTVSKIKEFLDGWVLINNLKDADFFQRKDALLNCRNGVLDFTTKELHEHSPDYGFTYCLDYDYDPKADCPTFDKVLYKVTCERQELVDIMLEYFGYCFSNMPMRWHKCMVLLGDGSNGKSTLLQTLKHLAGVGNGCSVLNLAEIQHERNRVELIGKLFNVSEETPKRSLSDSSLFKNLVGGESFVARPLYAQPIYVRENRTKLIMAANALPYNNDTSSGFFRRLIIIPFEATFSEKTADYNIHDKLKSELSGILNRVIEGYERLVKQGNFTDSNIVREMRDDYVVQSDPLRMFIAENIEVEHGNKVKSNDAYNSYVNWCVYNNKPRSVIETQNSFSRKVKKIIPEAIFSRDDKFRYIVNIKVAGQIETNF